MLEFKNRIGKVDKISLFPLFLKYSAWWILKVFQVTKYITYPTTYKKRDLEIRQTMRRDNVEKMCKTECKLEIMRRTWLGLALLHDKICKNMLKIRNIFLITYIPVS